MAPFVFFVVLLSVSYVSASSAEQPRCPDVKAVESYNITDVPAIWYQYARYANEIEDPSRCRYYKTKSINDTVLLVQSLDLVEGSPHYIESIHEYANIEQHSGDVIFSIFYGIPRQNQKLRMKVLVANDKYQVFYNCTYDETDKIIRHHLWIGTSSLDVGHEVEESIQENLKLFKFLDLNQLLWATRFEGTCRLVKKIPL